MAPYLTEKWPSVWCFSLGIGMHIYSHCEWLMGDGKTWDIASAEWMLSSFLRLRSRNAGLIGVVTISILNVNSATISDMGGLRSAWGWRQRNATWNACITSFSTNPFSWSFGSTSSNVFELSWSFHAYHEDLYMGLIIWSLNGYIKMVYLKKR